MPRAIAEVGSAEASRAVVSWRLANTIDASFCIAALDEALARYGKPKNFNTDQGSLPGLDPGITGAAFTGKLEAAGGAISMDGRGRFMDNIFIERLWRSIKYEEVHLKATAGGREARAGIGHWMTFSNSRRPHQAMNNQMTMAMWRASMDRIEAAARSVDMPLRLDNPNALPTSLRWPFHQASLDGTFGQLRPRQKQKQPKAASFFLNHKGKRVTP